jgi:hypothetical protein
MSEQKPSVGRVVHYVAYGTPGGEFPAGVCRAAVITEVNARQSGRVVQLSPDGTQMDVGLCVLNPTGQFFNQGVPYSAEVKPGTWHWPERT